MTTEETIKFVEQLRDAATMCLGDDLGDLASYMRTGTHPEQTGPFAAAIEVHDHAVRADELCRLADHLGAQLGVHGRSAVVVELMSLIGRRMSEFGHA